jgi:hypothetical protein
MIQNQPDDFPDNSRIGDLLGQPDAIEWIERARGWSPQSGVTWIERLRKDGIRLPDPDRVSNQHLPALVRRLVLSLAERGLYVLHTDHLTDAELYRYLIVSALAVPAPPRQPGAFEIIDLCPPYGAGIELMLSCYASDEARAELAAEGLDLPPRKPLIANRDRTLPQPPPFTEPT